MKKVYTCFCTDVIHEGHLNILSEAKKYGQVIVGVLSDEAMIRFNRFPTITLEERKRIVEDTGLADSVILQNEIMYEHTGIEKDLCGKCFAMCVYAQKHCTQ